MSYDGNYTGFLVEDDNGNLQVNENPDTYEYDNYNAE